MAELASSTTISTRESLAIVYAGALRALDGGWERPQAARRGVLEGVAGVLSSAGSYGIQDLRQAAVAVC